MALSGDAVVSRFDLAVLGADEPLGEVVLARLGENDIQIGELFPLTLDEPEGIVSFAGVEWPLLAAADFDFQRAQAVLVTSRAPAVNRLVTDLRARYPTMPLLATSEIPPAPAEAVARVLRALAGCCEIEAVDAFATLPVSVAGKAAVEELANQTIGLFNMEEPDPEIFPLRVAFNLIPDYPGSRAGYDETRLARAVVDLVAGPAPVFTLIWSPLFHGATVALHARTRRPADLDAARVALRARDGITLMEADLPAATPTPATDAQDSPDVFVGRVRADADGIRVWLVFDPAGLEAARMVSAVENWIDKPANSVLT